MAEFRLSALAEDDLTAIWGYVAGYTEETADGLVEQLVKRFHHAFHLPRCWKGTRRAETRSQKLPCRPYVIFYRIIPEEIEIISDVHLQAHRQRSQELE